MGSNIYTIHPNNNIYVRIYMQYIARNMKINLLHHCIQHKNQHLGLSTFWCVDVLACRRFGLSTFWSVDVLVCRRFGLSTFWFVDVLVCRRFGLSTFRSVDVSVCRRFGLSTFWMSTFRFVDVLTSYHWNNSLFECLLYDSLDRKFIYQPIKGYISMFHNSLFRYNVNETDKISDSISTRITANG